MLNKSFPSAGGFESRISPAGVLAIAGLHAALIALLLAANVVKLPPEMTTLMVRVIQPEPARQPEVTPPRPKPVARQPAPRPAPQPAPQPRIIAADTATPTPAAEAPAVKAAPPPAPAPAPAAAPAPPAASEPRFDADYLDNPAPIYPAMARRLEESGKTLLRVYVEPSGKPSQILVKTSSGSPRLDQAALDAVWRWKFVPARRGEEALGAWVVVPIVFNLKG